MDRIEWTCELAFALRGPVRRGAAQTTDVLGHRHRASRVLGERSAFDVDGGALRLSLDHENGLRVHSVSPREDIAHFSGRQPGVSERENVKKEKKMKQLRKI